MGSPVISTRITVGTSPPVAVAPEGTVFIHAGTSNSGKTLAYEFIMGAWRVIDEFRGGGVVCDGVCILPAMTVANLPAPIAQMIGWKATVTDATQAVSSVSFAAVITGGGANTLPVWCDGAAWRVG